MNHKTLAGLIAATAAVGVLALIPGVASAHIPDAVPSCSKLTITASDYPQGYTLTGYIDDAPVHIGQNPWSQTVDHVWSVTISAPDWPTYTASGTQVACRPPETTMPATTIPATTIPVPETTEPETTVPETTAPPETAAPTTTAVTDIDSPTTVPPATIPPINGPADSLPAPAPEACVPLNDGSGRSQYRYTFQDCTPPCTPVLNDDGSLAGICTPPTQPVPEPQTPAVSSPLVAPRQGTTLPTTGTAGTAGTIAIATGALVAGSGLMIVTRRRRRPSADTA